DRQGGRRVKVQRGGIVLVEDKDHDPDQKDEELHGNLQKAIEDQAQLALPQGFPGKVALYLALVRAKIGQGQEKAPGDPAPEGIAVGRVKGKIQDVEFIVGPRDLQGLFKG